MRQRQEGEAVLFELTLGGAANYFGTDKIEPLPAQFQ
jgi:hypothetical protein